MSDVTATNLPLDDGAGAALVAALVLVLRAHDVFPERADALAAGLRARLAAPALSQKRPFVRQSRPI